MAFSTRSRWCGTVSTGADLVRIWKGWCGFDAVRCGFYMVRCGFGAGLTRCGATTGFLSDGGNSTLRYPTTIDIQTIYMILYIYADDKQ